MENSIEDRVSSMIDSLNHSRKPGEIPAKTGQTEVDEITEIAVSIKNLPEIELPRMEYVSKVAAQIRARDDKSRQFRFESWFTRIGVVAAGLLMLLLVLSPWSFFSGRDVVFAMEEKVKELTDYHGILEMRTVTGDNQSWLVHRAEIWNQGDRYVVKDQAGVLTVNNGERKWQVQPEEKLITLLPVLPDPLQGRFDLQAEAARAVNYPHKVIGTEKVSGREAAKVEISPPGGLPYCIWIDEETKMPIQLQTAMQNAVQTVYTMVNLEINQGISGDIFVYKPDSQYKVVEKGAGKLVSTLDEAVAIAGFTPIVPKDPPTRISAAENRIALDYNGTVLTQTKTAEPLNPAPNASIGKADGGVLEILGEQLRWQGDGIEFSIEGHLSLELARQIVNDLSMPDPSADLSNEAKVIVPVDLEIVKNTQQQVDRGSSPWNLDPVQVSQVFINFELKANSPVGIDDIELETNTGSQALYTVKNGPVTKIYLKRVLRQDESGIWSVVGYDLR